MASFLASILNIGGYHYSWRFTLFGFKEKKSFFIAAISHRLFFLQYHSTQLWEAFRG
jgi:hypothetical protein